MLSRREFLGQATTAAAGLTIGMQLPGLADAAPAATPFEPNVFVRIAESGIVTIWVARLEMGQGVRTLLPMILAEELDVEWRDVRVEQAQPGGKFAAVELHTSGSGSSRSAFRVLRLAGAAAREMLVTAASVAWKVDAATCVAERGAVRHTPSGRTVSYGALASAAATLPIPSRPVFKDRARYRILGHPMKRVDGPAIVAGTAKYGLDIRMPGMLYASIERAPTLGASLAGFDEAAARRVHGVRHVVRVTRGVHAGVAVIADDTWSALRGRSALAPRWTNGPAHDFDSDRFLADLPRAFDAPQFKVWHEGDADAALAASHSRLSATYVFPFQAHAPLETMNCTADVRADGADVWVPTQTDVRSLDQVVKVTGLRREQVRLHCTLVGGGFGRRLFADFVAEATELSLAVARPVQLLWSRADDLRHGYFQPATAERFTAGLDASGALAGLVHQTTSSDLTIYDIHGGRNIWTGAPKPPRAADAYASDQSPWGAYDNPYAIPNLRVDCADVTSPIPTGPWRAVEYPSTVFGRESFLDELAHLAGKDPIAYRLALLPRTVKQVGPYAMDMGRLAHVLEVARDRSGWARVLDADRSHFRGRGVAVGVYHGQSYLAMIAEVDVAKDLSDIRVRRITTVVDCGLALNPLGVDGQTESAITWGLSATLFGKMNFKAGAAVQSSYVDFPVLRMDRMPQLDTVIVESDAAPGGYGEHPVPLVAPAVANAVFAACGRRVRSLPITSASLA